MKSTFAVVLFMLSTLSVSAVYGQQGDEAAARNRTRDQLAALLEKTGAEMNVVFKQGQKQPFKYVGSLGAGLVNAESFEILINVTASDTIAFRIYPHYNKGYINVDKAKDRTGLMKTLLQLNDHTFLFWGADEGGDIFTGYTFTLESGFPQEAIRIVLLSIANSDKFVGEMRPFIDGTSAGKVQ
jgi:hypothetical protein